LKAIPILKPASGVEAGPSEVVLVYPGRAVASATFNLLAVLLFVSVVLLYTLTPKPTGTKNANCHTMFKKQKKHTWPQKYQAQYQQISGKISGEYQAKVSCQCCAA